MHACIYTFFNKASIVEWKLSEIDTSKIIYIIEVTKRGSEKWQLKKRYKEFDELHKNLKKLYPNLPSLPGKTLFAVKDPAELEKRKQRLDDYLKSLISRPDAYFSDPMKQFLALDEHAADQIINKASQVGELTGFVHGVRDFIYDSEQGILFALCGNMNVALRVDAYLTNFRFPWEMNQTATVISVGTLECWVQSDKNSNNFAFEKGWSIAYPLQAISLHWESESSILSIGLDEGKVAQVIVRKDTASTRQEEIFSDAALHEQRVMGIYYDGKQEVLYTCSEDKTLKASYHQEIIATANHSLTGLTGMVGDKENKRLFVTNRSGMVFIYSIEKVNPVLVQSLKTQNQGVIRGLALDVTKNYVFTGGFDDGEIAVFDIVKPGKEKLSKLSASLIGKKKVRSVSWSSNRNEIYVGTQDGTITIWDTKKGQPIYVIKGHDEEITKVQWIEAKGILLTSAKEKNIKFWNLPSEWRDKFIERNEAQENFSVMQAQSMLKVKENIKRLEYDSDEDDLKGWHIY